VWLLLVIQRKRENSYDEAVQETQEVVLPDKTVHVPIMASDRPASVDMAVKTSCHLAWANHGADFPVPMTCRSTPQISFSKRRDTVRRVLHDALCTKTCMSRQVGKGGFEAMSSDENGEGGKPCPESDVTQGCISFCYRRKSSIRRRLQQSVSVWDECGLKSTAQTECVGDSRR
jgi:hypothetical protein